MGQEYDVIESCDLERFKECVSLARGLGWKLQGGVGMAISESGKHWYVQALIRDASGVER